MATVSIDFIKSGGHLVSYRIEPLLHFIALSFLFPWITNGGWKMLV